MTSEENRDFWNILKWVDWKVGERKPTKAQPLGREILGSALLRERKIKEAQS